MTILLIIVAVVATLVGAGLGIMHALDNAISGAIR